MVFGLLIGPTLPSFNPAARAEFVLKVIPKYVRYVTGFALMTVVFGVLLVADIESSNSSALSLSNSFGAYIAVGATSSLLALIVAMAVIGPAAKKIVSLTAELVRNPSPPPPDLMKANARLRAGASAGLILLVLALIFMVAGVNG